jgi:hypothetical protein
MDPQVPFRFLPCNSSTFKSPKKRRKLRKANRCSGLAAPEGVAQGRRTGGATPGSRPNGDEKAADTICFKSIHYQPVTSITNSLIV